MNSSVALSQGAASSPFPEDEETDVYNKISLSWKSGQYIAEGGTHNVFFGAYFNDVNEATIANPLGVTVSAGQAADVNTFNPGKLEYGKTYYWRVDEVNAPSKPGSFKGRVWQFTVEPVALKVPAANIIATAKSSASKNDPNDTINENGLNDANHPDWHTISGGMWLSAATDVNNPAWIKYEFSELYKLHEMFVWNHNAKIGTGGSGFKDTIIEYSQDGQTWTQLAAIQFNRATGKSDYVYNTTVPFNGAVAKYVRITALGNWANNQNGAGLSEVRFTYIPVRARKPSPETGSADVPVNKILTWRSGREAVIHKLYISTSESAVANRTAAVNQTSVSSFSPSLNLGTTYYWRVDEVNNSMIPSLWEDGIWSFSTVEYISIDNFEDYNDEPGYEVWSTWSDGFFSADNGSQMGNTNPPYCEKTIVQNGKQSVPVFYDNTAPAKYSEVERVFGSSLNWSLNGADTLRLYYRGNSVTFQQGSDGKSFAMSGEGTDIWGTADQFRFAYKTLTGNGSIIARVDSLQNTNVWAKAGVMIRNTLDANSVHAMTIMAASGTSSFQRRTTRGGTSLGTDNTNIGFPYWVKISRSGNTLTSQRSADGVNWVSFEADPNASSSVTITPALNNAVYIGLAVTSHTANVLAAATFSGVATTGNVTGSWTVAEIGDEDQADGVNTLDNLYIALEDDTGKRAKVFAPELAVGSGSWMEWRIPYTDFTGVNKSRIKKIAIGIGDVAAPLQGKGFIYIDNISYGHSLAK
jgi:hypothetical protein